MWLQHLVTPFITPSVFLRNTLPGGLLCSLQYYPLLRASLIAFALSIIVATIVAYKMKFAHYSLHAARGPLSVSLGCLFFWLYFFPCFLFNWVKIARSRAKRRNETTQRKSPDLALPVTVYVIWTLLMAMGLPGLFLSPVRYNDSMAVMVLRKYWTAQIEFRQPSLATSPGNPPDPGKYCEDFRILRYDIDWHGREQPSFPSRIAEARLTDEPDTGTAFFGFFFLEDPYVSTNGLWATHFGMVAYPECAGCTGNDLYWIGPEGDVLYRRIDEGKDTRPVPLRPEESPLAPQGTGLWSRL